MFAMIYIRVTDAPITWQPGLISSRDKLARLVNCRVPLHRMFPACVQAYSTVDPVEITFAAEPDESAIRIPNSATEQLALVRNCDP